MRCSYVRTFGVTCYRQRIKHCTQDVFFRVLPPMGMASRLAASMRLDLLNQTGIGGPQCNLPPHPSWNAGRLSATQTQIGIADTPANQIDIEQCRFHKPVREPRSPFQSRFLGTPRHILANIQDCQVAYAVNDQEHCAAEQFIDSGLKAVCDADLKEGNILLQQLLKGS